MTYAYKDYWAEISPVFDQRRRKVVYWHYKIYAFFDEFLFDGYDGDRPSAIASAQAHIERLNAESRLLRVA